MKFTVPDMSCNHCVNAITNAVKELDPGAQVQADLETKLVTVTTGLDPAAVAQAITDAGYAPTPATE